jgi:hypothetical protein
LVACGDPRRRRRGIGLSRVAAVGIERQRPRVDDRQHGLLRRAWAPVPAQARVRPSCDGIEAGHEAVDARERAKVRSRAGARVLVPAGRG